ncbi:MAG: PAS domain S-box protein [Pseudomonadota bacterium]
MESKNIFQEASIFEALFQGITDYVVAINKNYQIIMVNDLFKSHFGMDTDNYCYKIWKNREEKCDSCSVERSFQDGQPHWGKEDVVREDGKTVHVLTKSIPIKDGRGEIMYVLQTANDPTLKKNFQAALNKISGNLEIAVTERLKLLEQSEEKYRTIFERSHDAIILTDAKADILEINPAALRIMGFKARDRLAPGSALALFEDPEKLLTFQRKLFREGFVTEFEARLLRKDGTAFDALITSSVIPDIIRQVTGYVILIRDITRRKRVLKEIEKQNIRLAALNAVSTTVSSSLDLNKVLGSTIEQMLDILEPKSVRIYLLDEERKFLTLAAHKGVSEKFIRKDHVVRRRVGDGLLGITAMTGKIEVVDNLLRSNAPYVDFLIEEGLRSTIYVPLVAKGETVGAMCVSSRSPFKFEPDFVEFLTAIGNQIGVAVHNAELYENIKKAYQGLKDAQEQVIRTEKLASLGKLSATIAHEINNPLAAVLNYIRLMIKLINLGRFTPERLKDISRYLATMESETANCGEVVKNLLAFSRQSTTHIEANSIEEIIDRTLKLITHDLQLREIHVTREIEPDLPRVLCDFRQIQQALLNLLSNASEAIGKRGTIRLTSGHSKEGNSIDITISDTGCGIPHEALQNIFEPFFTTKGEGKGVGLGLSVVYGIITNHNGSIEVKSEPEKGSTFKIRLPAAV